jgi:hypothetical protein
MGFSFSSQTIAAHHPIAYEDFVGFV